MRSFSARSLIFALVFCAASSYVGNAVQLAKLTATNGVSGDVLGTSVAAGNDIIFVGAPSHAVRSDVLQGAVYGYVKSATGWKTMTQSGIVVASDGQAYDLFGISVAINENTLVVGARRNGDGNGCQPGKAYVFVKPGKSWSTLKQVAELTASDGAPCDGFGESLSISGNTIVVGAYEAMVNEINAGAAYVFVEPAGGWKNMTQTAKLTASDPRVGGYLGNSVSTDGKTVVAGAPQGAFTGEAYVYVEPAPGWTNMTETAKLTGSDAKPGDFFGDSVSLRGITMIVGSPYHSNAMQGAGYIFVEPPSGWTNSTETAELTVPDSQIPVLLGTSVLIEGNTALMGAPDLSFPGFRTPGAVYIFTKPAAGWQTTSKFKTKLVSRDGFTGDNFGQAIAMTGNTAIVGAIFVHWDPSFEYPGAGAAYIFGP